MIPLFEVATKAEAGVRPRSGRHPVP